MKWILTSLLLVFCGSVTAQLQLVKMDLSKSVKMEVPSELERLPTTTAQRAIRTFIAEFRHRDGRTELEVSQSKHRWKPSDANLLKQFYKASIMQLYDRVDMKKEELKQEGGRPVIYYEYVSTIIDDSSVVRGSSQRSDYNVLKYVVLEDGVLICRFTTPLRNQAYWQESIATSFASLRLK